MSAPGAGGGLLATGDGGDTVMGLGGAMTPGGGKLVGMADGMGVGVVGALVGALVGLGVGVGEVPGVGVGAVRSVHVERALLTLRAQHAPRRRLLLRACTRNANAVLE